MISQRHIWHIVVVSQSVTVDIADSYPYIK